MNYMTKPSSIADEYYNEEDTYAVNDKTGVSDLTPKAPIRKIGIRVKEIKVGTMELRQRGPVCSS